MAGVDGQVVGLLEGMIRSYGGRPVWVKVVRDDALLLLDPDDIARALRRVAGALRRRPRGQAQRAWPTSSRTR